MMGKGVKKLPSGREIAAYFLGLDKKAKIRLVGILLGSLIFMVFIAWPAWVIRPEVQGKIRGLKGNLAVAESRIRQEAKMAEEERQYDVFIRESLSRFFTESEAQGLIGVLTDLGEKSGVTLLSTQPQSESFAIPDPFKEKYTAASYVLALEGGFHAVATFVSELENYPKILRVDDLSLSPREEDPTALVGEVRLTAFLLKEGNIGTKQVDVIR